MRNQAPKPSCPPSLNPQADQVPSPDALPALSAEEISHWLTTEQAAERFSLSPREFRRYAGEHPLPKRKSGTRVYYAPEVIEAAAEERSAKKAALEQKKDIQQAEEVTGAEARAPIAAAKPELLLQALAAAQVQTALVDRIVQNIGRMG